MIAFWALAVIVILPAALIVFEKSIVRAAFWLLGTLLGVSGFYILLGADFLGFTQVMVYIGGINVLILFGIMLTQRDPVYLRRNIKRTAVLPIALLSLVFLFTLLSTLFSTTWNNVPRDDAATSARLGTLLMGEYILPFEIISVLLLVVLVGAAYLARRTPQGAK